MVVVVVAGGAGEAEEATLEGEAGDILVDGHGAIVHHADARPLNGEGDVVPLVVLEIGRFAVDEVVLRVAVLGDSNMAQRGRVGVYVVAVVVGVELDVEGVDDAVAVEAGDAVAESAAIGGDVEDALELGHRGDAPDVHGKAVCALRKGGAGAGRVAGACGDTEVDLHVALRERVAEVVDGAGAALREAGEFEPTAGVAGGVAPDEPLGGVEVGGEVDDGVVGADAKDDAGGALEAIGRDGPHREGVAARAEADERQREGTRRVGADDAERAVDAGGDSDVEGGEVDGVARELAGEGDGRGGAEGVAIHGRGDRERPGGLGRGGIDGRGVDGRGVFDRGVGAAA